MAKDLEFSMVSAGTSPPTLRSRHSVWPMGGLPEEHQSRVTEANYTRFGTAFAFALHTEYLDDYAERR